MNTAAFVLSIKLLSTLVEKILDLLTQRPLGAVEKLYHKNLKWEDESRETSVKGLQKFCK